jgi:type VI secretion system secreted protein Hcp
VPFLIFMKYGSIEGSVTTQGLEGWIELDSFSWGASNPSSTSPGAGSAGKVSVSDITVGKSVDRATVALIKELVAGQVTDGVLIQFYKDMPAGPQEYLQFTLDNTLVTSYSLSSEADEASDRLRTADTLGPPTESLSLSFVKFDIQYTDQTGVQDVGWDESTGSLTSAVP